MHSSIDRPRLAFPAKVEGNGVVIERSDNSFVVKSDSVDSARLAHLFSQMDGSRTLGDLSESYGDADAVNQIVAELDRNALLDEAKTPHSRSGLDVILELEDLSNHLHGQIMEKNTFWSNLADPAPDTPRSVLHGFCIENYHFLFREGYFDSPVLSYQVSTKIRLIMNEFYAEEYGHDEILLKSLNTLGFTREDLADTMPLPQTMALCNALAWWSMTDPLFFFTTLGVLEGQGIREGEQDFVLDACDKLDMDKAFVEPIRTHAKINQEGDHGNLTRAIFREIPCLDEATVRRLRSQMHLFYEIYDAFYAGVWNHYSKTSTLLRRVSEL